MHPTRRFPTGPVFSHPTFGGYNSNNQLYPIANLPIRLDSIWNTDNEALSAGPGLPLAYLQSPSTTVPNQTSSYPRRPDPSAYVKSKMEADPQLAVYCRFLENGNNAARQREPADEVEEVKTSPLFGWTVKSFIEWYLRNSMTNLPPSQQPRSTQAFSQFALLGRDLGSKTRKPLDENYPAVFLNTNAPWSAFLCGSQGSGKSYTLSCMLENCLMQDEKIGQNPNPLGGVVFAYDSHSGGNPCEAAYLASNIPVTVLVSPSNFVKMRALYTSMPEVGNRIKVYPLFLAEKNLNTERMLRLMAFNANDNAPPLYMEVIISILKQMAMSSQQKPGFNFKEFVRQIENANLDTKQRMMMNLRLQLLESFMDSGSAAGQMKGFKANRDIFMTMPGHLTIVDLTDPFVDNASCCMLMDVCLALMLENQSTGGRVVALDEAHKFMTKSFAAGLFTESLLMAIREQRHKGVRVIIATQEPTISSKLLDLCSMTFVHRFTSPEWFSVLKDHLAGASPLASLSRGLTNENAKDKDADSELNLFKDIVNLNVGESLVFSPSAVLDFDNSNGGKINKLGLHHMKFKTRPRITLDGGRSIIANIQ